MLKRIILYVFAFGIQCVVFGQDAIGSLNINVNNVQLSADAKTLSFDVSLQSINQDTVTAIPSFLIRLAIPQVDLGTKAKIVTVTNATKELGVRGESITESNGSWLVKFQNGIFITSYSDALMADVKFPGVRIGTVNISHVDGSAFPNPLTFNLKYAGSDIKTKSTCSVFKPSLVKLAASSTAAQPASNFSGLRTYTVSALSADTASFSLFPNPASDRFDINLGGDKTAMLTIFDLRSCVVLSQLITGSGQVNISSLLDGVYIVDVNGIREKLIKK